jgi:ferredoxin--NADP+ reductase
MAKPLDYNATIVARHDLMANLAVFRVRTDAPVTHEGVPGFVPGQYLTLGLNRPGHADDGDPRPLSVRRPMSIASSPDDRDAVEFYVRYVEQPESDLPLTHLLWACQPGDRMYVRPVAAGTFTLADTVGRGPARRVLMLAAGTGLAPFVSIVRARVARDPAARLDDLSIIHGASYVEALGYRDELEQLARTHGLGYVPTVSRPQEAPGWRGATGRAEALLTPERLPETEVALGCHVGALTPETCAVLVCGLRGTIEGAIHHLAARGFVPDNRRLRRALGVPEELPSTLFFENYDSAPVVDVRDPAAVARLRAVYAGVAPWAAASTT